MKVGQYELGKTIGRGAFSKVKVACHMETGEEFVLKIIDKLGGGSKTVRDVKTEVKLEISIMKRLTHANIVRMYEVMESSKHYYIVLESVRGGDLCDHIMTEGKLSEKVASSYFRDLCQGLRHCHEAGVAHRDIKPENCLISKSGILKVADFGLSRFHKGRCDTLEKTDFATDAVGTLSYAAPEVLDGPYNAFKADLWSSGVVVFVMLTGKFPFGSKGYTDAQIQQDIKAGRINRFPTTISKEAKDLIVSLIVVDADSRLGLGGALSHEWLDQLTKKPAEKKSRPNALDIEKVQEEAKAETSNAIGSTMSPQWADSPASGARQKFTPALFSPKAAQTPPPVLPSSPPPAPSSSGLNMSDLKSLLEKERKELGFKS